MRSGRFLPTRGAVLCAGLLAAQSLAHDDHKEPPVPSITWGTCGPAFPDAECATALVPLDYDQPHGPTTEIALARIPATDKAHRMGTVFINPGGPGGSGVGFVRNGFGAYLASLLEGRFDVVGFDPRGVRRSEPLLCFDSAASEDAFFSGLPIFPYLPSQERPYFETYRQFTAHCLASDSRVRSHMSTADVARDLDLLRRAVGDRLINFLGFSYGSYIGNTYANLFPERIRALVIDGVLDPRLWSSGWQTLSDRVNTQREFAEFLRLCDEAGASLCPLSGPAGAAARFDALAEELRSSPFVFPDGFVYSYDFLVGDATGAMYAPEDWSFYGEYFGSLADAVLGDVSAAARAAEIRSRLVALHAESDREVYNNGFDAFWGNSCADIEYPRSFLAQKFIGDFAARGSIFGPFWWWTSGPGCADWPVAPDRFIGPWSTRTSAPALVVGNYFDGVTSYEGAQESNRLLKGSRLLSYAGWGHTAFSRSDCVTGHVVAYLLDGTLPPEGTVCPANPSPFLPPPALRALGRAAAVPLQSPMVGLPPPWIRPGR